jgi:hypothetical protein
LRRMRREGISAVRQTLSFVPSSFCSAIIKAGRYHRAGAGMTRNEVVTWFANRPCSGGQPWPNGPRCNSRRNTCLTSSNGASALEGAHKQMEEAMTESITHKNNSEGVDRTKGGLIKATTVLSTTAHRLRQVVVSRLCPGESRSARCGLIKSPDERGLIESDEQFFQQASFFARAPSMCERFQMSTRAIFHLA